MNGIANANRIEIAWEAFGRSGDPPLILIMGLGSQMIGWPAPFCRMLSDAGYRVIRFDNRDVGFSSKLDHLGAPNPQALAADRDRGRPVQAPYALSDMAADVIGLMDALSLSSAHVLGISMGGMIAQIMAIENPDRLESLLCLATTSGETDLPPSTPEAAEALMSKPPVGKDAYAEHAVRVLQVFSGGSDRFDPDLQRRISAAAYERMWHPSGFARQMAAILTAGGRRQALQSVRTPTAVIHGDCDPLFPIEHGKDIAEAVAGSRLTVVGGLGHGMAYPSLWRDIVKAVSETAPVR